MYLEVIDESLQAISASTDEIVTLLYNRRHRNNRQI